MDKMFIRKDVYEELLEKGFGKKDYSKLTKKVITDKNGHRRTVFVRNGEQPAEVKQPKAQEGLTPEKKAKYEEMLEKVKAGSDENALFVRGEMLNKKDAIAYLENKLGKKPASSSAQGHLESDTPQNTDITKEDEERFGKQALSGLSGKRTTEPTQDDMKENYLDAKNDGGKDIADENRIDEHSSKAIKLNHQDREKLEKFFSTLAASTTNVISELVKEEPELYKKLIQIESDYKIKNPNAKGKTFSFDLTQKFLEDSFNEYKKNNPVNGNKFVSMSGDELVNKYASDLPIGRWTNTKSALLDNIKSELNFQEYYKKNGSTAFNENKYNFLNAAKDKIDEIATALKLK